MRKIIHIDMDAFFASVEQRDNPAYRGRPLIVGGSPSSRGVVCSASYEARKFGIRSAMSTAKAYALCPDAIFVPVRMDAYREVSQTVMQIFSDYSDLVEAVSIDEAYLDVTTNKKNLVFARDVARALRADIKSQTGLTASAGVAPSKFLAKLASDMNKPDGITIIAPDMIEKLLESMPVRKLPGVGPATEEKLKTIGIQTTKDLRSLDRESFVKRFGKYGVRLLDFAHGLDDRPVRSDRIRKSIGVERTFSIDVRSKEDIISNLKMLSEKLSERLNDRMGRTLTLKVKFSNFQIITRSKSYEQVIKADSNIFEEAEKLFYCSVNDHIPIRLLGLSISSLGERITKQPLGSSWHQLVLPF